MVPLTIAVALPPQEAHRTHEDKGQKCKVYNAAIKAFCSLAVQLLGGLGTYRASLRRCITRNSHKQQHYEYQFFHVGKGKELIENHSATTHNMG